MTSDPTLKSPPIGFLAILKREFSKPIVLINVTLLLLAPMLLTPVIYFGLWTFTLVPSGAILWALIVCISLVIGWCFYTSFAEAIRFGKRIRPLRLAAETGDESAKNEYVEFRKTRRPRFNTLLLGVNLFWILIPALGVLTMMNGDKGHNFLIKEKGSMRYSTRSEDVRNYMKAIEKRGIFHPLGN